MGIFCAWLLLWGLASLAAPYVVKGVAPKMVSKARSMGVEMDKLEYDHIRVSPFLTSVTAKDVSVSFDLNPQDRYRLSSSFQCESIRVSLTDGLKLNGRVTMERFQVHFHQADMPKELPFDSFTDGQAELANVPLLAPREAFRDMLVRVVELFKNNKTSSEFEFSGNVQLKIKDKNWPARIYTEREAGEFRLRFSEDDVRLLADEMGLHLGDEQIDMVSHYPLRVPVIGLSTEKARMISLRYYSGDLWKQDALRHVVWSYLLTEAFGPDFAKIVTDAQEAKPGNEHYERLMDYHNNAVGRILFDEKVPLSRIPGLIVRDSRIVLSPEDAKERGVERLLK